MKGDLQDKNEDELYTSLHFFNCYFHLLGFLSSSNKAEQPDPETIPRSRDRMTPSFVLIK